MRKKTAEFSDVSYYFGGEFRIYRHLFDARCPTPMKCLKGMIILRPGQTKGWMYYLCSGLLKVYMNNCEGNERSVAFITNDTLFGMDCFIPGQVSLTTIECMTDSWVMPFQSSVLEEIIRENADFAIDFARYYCKMLRQLCFDAENQSINNVLVRMVNSSGQLGRPGQQPGRLKPAGDCHSGQLFSFKRFKSVPVNEGRGGYCIGRSWLSHH